MIEGISEENLTPSLPRCHLKMTIKSAKFETQAFLFSFSHWNLKGFSSTGIAFKVEVTDIEPENRLFAGMSVYFQPRNLTGWGSEVVNDVIRKQG